MADGKQVAARLKMSAGASCTMNTSYTRYSECWSTPISSGTTVISAAQRQILLLIIDDWQLLPIINLLVSKIHSLNSSFLLLLGLKQPSLSGPPSPPLSTPLVSLRISCKLSMYKVNLGLHVFDIA